MIYAIMVFWVSPNCDGVTLRGAFFHKNSQLSMNVSFCRLSVANWRRRRRRRRPKAEIDQFLWQAELIFIHFFQIFEIIISDIWKNYFGYPKTGTYFRYPKKVISDIKNNNFGYPKINIYFGHQKLLFWISEVVISDIWNSLLDIWN